MEFNATTRSYIGSAIGLVAAFIVFLFTPSVHYKPVGIYLPWNASKTPTQSAEVKLFREGDTPFLYKKLGSVNVEMHSLAPSLNTQQMMVRYAQDLAAQHGGKGIIVNQFFHSSAGPSLLATGILQGTVIAPLNG